MSAWVDSANEARGGSDADLHTSAGGDTPVAAAVAVPGRPRRRNEHAHGQDTTTRNQMQGTHTKETNGTPETRQKEAGKAQRHSRMDDSRGTMEGTAHMAAQMMAQAAAGAVQQGSVDSARDNTDTVRTHVNGSECIQGDGGGTAPAVVPQHTDDSQAGQRTQATEVPAEQDRASSQMMTEPATEEQGHEWAHAEATADEEARSTEETNRAEGGRHTARTAQADGQWIDTAAAHSSTQAQGEGEEMTAEHGAEQIPVAVKTVEETKYVEEMHKMAKSTEPATEAQEPLSADRPLHSTQSAVHHSTQSKGKRRGMRAPATVDVDGRAQDAEQQASSTPKYKMAAVEVGNPAQQAKRPRGDTAAAYGTRDDEQSASGSKRVTMHVGERSDAARSGHAPVDGGGATDWPDGPSTCSAGVNASLQSSGIGGSDVRMHGNIHRMNSKV